jgi:hypothetical protein
LAFVFRPSFDIWLSAFVLSKGGNEKAESRPSSRAAFRFLVSAFVEFVVVLVDRVFDPLEIDVSSLLT